MTKSQNKSLIDIKVFIGNNFKLVFNYKKNLKFCFYFISPYFQKKGPINLNIH